MNVKAKGYVLGVIAAATYGMNPLFALPLYEAGMNPDSVLFFRYLFAIPVLGMMIKLRGRDFEAKRNISVNYHGIISCSFVSYLVPKL